MQIYVSNFSVSWTFLRANLVVFRHFWGSMVLEISAVKSLPQIFWRAGRVSKMSAAVRVSEISAAEGPQKFLRQKGPQKFIPSNLPRNFCASLSQKFLWTVVPEISVDPCLRNFCRMSRCLRNFCGWVVVKEISVAHGNCIFWVAFLLMFSRLLRPQ